jgi:type III pantothenate kinase
MNLIVDQGNTSIKIALFDKDEIIHFRRLPYGNLKSLPSSIRYTSCFISSVLKKEDQKKLERSFLNPKYMTHESLLPFVNKYGTPETLGLDRMANAAFCAAHYSNQNSLIIDVGTCLKFDFINDKNEYLGGAISPGLRMRYNALNNQTAKLPLLEAVVNVELIGKSTEESMQSGVQNGMKNEIIATISEYEHQYKQLNVFLTGGDANYFADALKNSIFADAFLTLKGINAISKLNA